MARGSSDHPIHPEPADGGDEDERYRLRPELFPRRLELELSAETLLALHELSIRTGRSASEIAEEIISRGMNAPQTETGE